MYAEMDSELETDSESIDREIEMHKALIEQLEHKKEKLK